MLNVTWTYVPNTQRFNAINGVGFVSEADPTKFILQDLTYLCFVRSSSDNTAFDEARISLLHTDDMATDQSTQATFMFCFDTFRLTNSNINTVTQDPHLTKNMTREDCQECQDNSTFARPTFS